MTVLIRFVSHPKVIECQRNPVHDIPHILLFSLDKLPYICICCCCRCCCSGFICEWVTCISSCWKWRCLSTRRQVFLIAALLCRTERGEEEEEEIIIYWFNQETLFCSSPPNFPHLYSPQWMDRRGGLERLNERKRLLHSQCRYYYSLPCYYYYYYVAVHLPTRAL